VPLLELMAWSHLSGCELTQTEAAEIQSSGLVDVVAEPQQEHWQLVSDSQVGVAVGPTWEVRITPRLDVPQLFFLLAYARDPKGWKDQEAAFASEPELLDAIAAGFSWHALRTIGQGLLRGYVHLDERLTTIRGRIRFGDQIARSATLPLPVEVSYDDYTANIIENQIIKTATLALLRLPRIPAVVRRRLHRLRALLDEIDVLPRPREVQVPAFTRLNERYRPALRLGELILRASSIDVSRGSIASVAFLFDMNRVFEDFVSTSLREALQVYGGEVQFQNTLKLDEDGQIPIRPDVIWQRSGRARAVIDAKYKALRPTGMPNADAYQMLAYCTALALRRGFLVYAKDSGEKTRNLTIKNIDCEIRIRTLDVERHPEQLLQEVAALAREIALSASDTVGTAGLVTPATPLSVSV
jgi:5-methylcytosine-specific restriction enzyme subunit McrC